MPRVEMARAGSRQVSWCVSDPHEVCWPRGRNRVRPKVAVVVIVVIASLLLKTITIMVSIIIILLLLSWLYLLTWTSLSCLIRCCAPRNPWDLLVEPSACDSQDSSKGGAVETGCSGLHSITGCCTIWYYPHPLHPPPTVPPFDEHPATNVARGECTARRGTSLDVPMPADMNRMFR